MPFVEEEHWVGFRDEGSERSQVQGMRSPKEVPLVFWRERVFYSDSRQNCLGTLLAASIWQATS